MGHLDPSLEDFRCGVEVPDGLRVIALDIAPYLRMKVSQV